MPMFIYTDVIAATESLTTAANMYTTNATPGNLTDHARYATAAGQRAFIQAVYGQGRDAAATSITGVSVRLIRLGTASTVGTAGSMRPKDPAAPAAALTFTTAPTIGSGTVSLQVAIGFGRAGPGGWVAPNPDSMIYLSAGGGANGNCDMISGSQGASILIDAWTEHVE